VQVFSWAITYYAAQSKVARIKTTKSVVTTDARTDARNSE
jgi:hypothetical protein